MTLKSGIFSLLANCVLLGISGGHVQPVIGLGLALDFQWCCLTDQGSPSVMQHIVSVESSSLLLHSYFT